VGPDGSFSRASRLTMLNPRRRDGWAGFSACWLESLALTMLALMESPRTHQDDPRGRTPSVGEPTVDETLSGRLYDAEQRRLVLTAAWPVA
jgi:hypothetical protein